MEKKSMWCDYVIYGDWHVFGMASTQLYLFGGNRSDLLRCMVITMWIKKDSFGFV